MKRLLCLLSAAAALLTAGCGSRSAPEPPEPLSVSMEATAVMGRSYVPEVLLPKAVTPMEQGGKDNLWRAAETAGGEAALYNLDSASGAVLVQWEGSLAMLDGWYFRTPQCVPPSLRLLDWDGDGTPEILAAVLYTGSGTGVSIEQLHLLTRDAHGSLMDSPLPEALYSQRLAELMTVKTRKRTGSVSIGNVSLSLPDAGVPYTGGPDLGSIVSYHFDTEGRLTMELGLGMEVKDQALPQYVGKVLCGVEFDSASETYTLTDFALQG